MESVPKITIFCLKMMVKSGLDISYVPPCEKIISHIKKFRNNCNTIKVTDFCGLFNISAIQYDYLYFLIRKTTF